MIANIRLGYACINETLKKQEGICVSRSCTQSTFATKGAKHAINLALDNLENVLRVLKWNTKNGIFLYRMSSDMFPHMTNPKFLKKDMKYVYDIENFRSICVKIGKYARRHGHRLTFHPGQFNVVGTPRADIFEKTCRELGLHADIMDMMELDKDSVMVVHGGGIYGDKKSTIKRWIKQFFKLPANVQKRLVIENCENSYSPLDMLKISRGTGCPVVFDTHHYDCYILKNKLPHPSKFLQEILETWSDRGIKPKFHISQQDPDKRIGAHSAYITEIPDYLFMDDEIDLMVEAKAKELAVLKLLKIYN